MPKFNLNWLYMIIALMLLGLWWSSDSRGSGSKVVPYSDFQKYVTNGYISKVLALEKTLRSPCQAECRRCNIRCGLHQSGKKPDYHQ